ncbi:MAG: mechanosensitive ion channel domain-containing protein [Solirubrobacteraceae bacterium]
MASPQSDDPRQRARARMFETRSQSWREAGLLREIDPHAVRRARVTALLLLPIFIGIVVLDHHLGEVGVPKKLEAPIQVVSVFALAGLGWVIAKDTGRAFGPMLFRRLEPGTAGTVGFLIRLATIGLAALLALDAVGVEPQTLAIGGALTAVVIGLAAQQTFGNLIAGTVLLSARPFRVGERVRLQGGALAGQVDGVVGSLGLLYTTFVAGDESILVPNSVVLSVMVITSEGRAGPVGWMGGGRRYADSEAVEPVGASAVPPPPTYAQEAAGASSAPPPPPRPDQRASR